MSVLLTADTSVALLLKERPYLQQILTDYAPAFARLTNTLCNDTSITLQNVSDLAALELVGLLAHLGRGIMEYEQCAVTLAPYKASA